MLSTDQGTPLPALVGSRPPLADPEIVSEACAFYSWRMIR